MHPLWNNFITDVASVPSLRSIYAYIGDSILYRAAMVHSLLASLENNKPLIKASKLRDKWKSNKTIGRIVDHAVPNGLNIPGWKDSKKLKADVFEAWLGYVAIHHTPEEAMALGLRYCSEIFSLPKISVEDYTQQTQILVQALTKRYGAY